MERRSEASKLTRRSLLRKGLAWLVSISIGGALYSFFAERNWIELRQVDLRLPRLPEAFRGIKVVHFSDLHLGFYMDVNSLTNVIEIINSSRPDLICFTGDFVDKSVGGLSDISPLLSRLEAPLGKFAALGNHDYFHAYEDVNSTLQSGGFQVLINKNAVIERNGERVFIVGVDDALFGSPDLEKAMDGIGLEEFVLLLAHEPDFAEVVKNHSIDLQLSGHSHGGQIRIPFVGHIVTPPLARKYIAGLYKLGNLALYVNRGIGTTIFPFRFYCRPEITLFHLN